MLWLELVDGVQNQLCTLITWIRNTFQFTVGLDRRQKQYSLALTQETEFEFIIEQYFWFQI